jgi:hypothetical protein
VGTVSTGARTAWAWPVATVAAPQAWGACATGVSGPEGPVFPGSDARVVRGRLRERGWACEAAPVVPDGSMVK